jgi:hypothetical protein
MVNANGLIKNRLAFEQMDYSFNWNSLIPYLRLEWVLEKIAEYLGVTLAGDFLPFVTNMLVYNPNGLDQYMPFYGPQNYLFWKREFNCNELIPDITMRDFLLAMCSRYNVGCTYNDLTNELVFSRKEPVANSYVYEDITSQAGKIGAQKDVSVDGMALKTEIDNTDVYAVADDYTFGNGEKDLPIKASALARTVTHKIVFNAPEDGTFEAGPNQAFGFTEATVSGPLVNQPQTQQYGIRFFHYTGLVDNGLFSYPSASINGPTWVERLDDANGIFKNFYEYWARFEAARKVINVPIEFTLAQLKDFDWQLRRRLDRKDYLVKSIEIRLTHQCVEVDNVELYTMRL